jgi:hypothetical protein
MAILTNGSNHGQPATRKDRDMSFFTRLTGVLLALAMGSSWTPMAAFAQAAPATYICPTHPVSSGRAPGSEVPLLRAGSRMKEYAVIFGKGDEAFSGLLDFADKYHVTNGHFTASGAVLG